MTDWLFNVFKVFTIFGSFDFTALHKILLHEQISDAPLSHLYVCICKYQVHSAECRVKVKECFAGLLRIFSVLFEMQFVIDVIWNFAFGHVSIGTSKQTVCFPHIIQRQVQVNVLFWWQTNALNARFVLWILQLLTIVLFKKKKNKDKKFETNLDWQ